MGTHCGVGDNYSKNFLFINYIHFIVPDGGVCTLEVEVPVINAYLKNRNTTARPVVLI